MFSLQVTPTAMELLPLLCLCVLTRAGTTFADQHGPEIKVKEGRNVTLPCSATEDIALRRFEWKKDDQKEVFVFDSGLDSNNGLSGQYVQFKGRVSYFSGELKNGNASITIRETKAADSGNYTCEIRHLPDQKFLIKLLVGAISKPYIQTNKTDNGVLLQCEVHGDYFRPKVQWQDRAGNILPAKEPLVSEGEGSYDIILQTTVTKTDYYRCVATQEEINHQIYAENYVSVNGAFQKPYVTILKQTKDWALLQCEVHAESVKPIVQWKDGAGNILPAKEPQVSKTGDSYDIILQTNVTKTDHYRCVATQAEIPSQIHVYISGVSEKKIPDGPLKDRSKENIPGAAPLPYVTILGETKDGVQLQCVVRGASPKPKVRWQDGAGNILPAKEPLVSERGDVILQTTVTKTDHYQCVATQEEINHQINATIYVPVTGAAPELSIKILGETQDGVQLQCVVHGASPKPKVQWQDGAGNILPAKEPQVSERGDVILQTTVTKTDHYRCVATQEEINHQIHAEIYVLMNSAVSKPSIMILGEREDRVQLQCEVHGASPKPKVQWQDRAGNILPAKEPQVSERGGSYDIILQTTVTKTDHYRCVATQEEINHQIYAETYVPVHGAAPEPSITTLDQTKDWALLQCVVRGASPKPKVQWQDSDGNILHAEESKVTERGGRYDIILQTTVTKTDHYRCVATQEEINHQIQAETFVHMSGAAPKPSVTILDETTDWALLQCEVHGASPKPEVRWQDGAGNILPAKEPQVSERGGSYDIILQTTVTKTDHYRCVATQEEIKHQIHAETYVHINGAAPLPYVTILGETQDGVQLQCVVRGASPKPKVQWQDGAGNILPAKEPLVSERGGRYDIILQTTVTKADHYQCVATQEEINHQINATIYVPVTGAVSKPFITTLGETQDGVQLQCEVRGASPKPKVQWQDRAGNILPAKEPQVSERGGSYDIILQTTVTKTDHYRCVATQEEINHQIHAETYVPVHGFSTGHVVTAVAAVLGTLLLVGVVVAVLRAKGCIKCSKGGAQTRVPHEDPNHLV
ncbi:hemicentin-1-like isoform X1 [Trachinotus anak]|uniref:hemicentin-1-like isoform X1 n=1 Tax=Trachinotus anak TaxID=443729 RepID=UPI0039F22B8B